MTINLDNRDAILTLDTKKMLYSMELLGKQVQEVLEQVANVSIPKNYRSCDRVVVAGMGGSTLGSHIVKSLFANEMSVPLEIVNDYHLPAYVNKKTLVVVSSYSGNTEETLAALEEAVKKNAKLLVITSGGTLGELAKKKKIPALVFTTLNNPCGSPRMGLGYSIIGQIALLAKAGVIHLRPNTIENLSPTMEKFTALFGVATPKEKNAAKDLAGQLKSRTVWSVGAEHLVGSVRAMTNQINENAKRFGGFFFLPELNHHLMEGLRHPKTNPDQLVFLFLESALYDRRISKRIEITKKILGLNKIKFLSYRLEAKDKLSQALECLIFGSYLSFYTAMLEDIDPTAVPFVDYLKTGLK